MSGTKTGNRYFSHDSDAFLDSRIIKMRAKLGLAGYGAYWMIIERLRTAEQYRHECDYDVFACLANSDAELFRSVIEDFDLFDFEENDGQTYFYSASLLRRMLHMEDIIEKRREAGRKGAEARWQTDDKPVTEPKVNHSKGIASAMPIAKQVPCDCHSTALAKNGKLNKTKLNKTKDISISAERSKDSSTDELVFIEMPLNDGTNHQVTMDDLYRYRELYQAVNVEQELRAMIGWLEANPARRKTSRGVKAFITGWLKRAQDKGVVGGNGQYGNHGKYVQNNRGNFKIGSERATGADAGYDTRMPRLTDDKENVEAAMRELFG